MDAQPEAKNPHAILGAEGAPDTTPASAASDDPVVERQKGVRITPLLAHEKVLPVRCQFSFSDGRQCTMGRSEIHPSLCPYHAEREEQLFGVPSPGGTVVGRAFDLPELYSACRDLTTAAGVNRALAQVFRLLAQRRISRQEAATFGYLAQLLLQTVHPMRMDVPSSGESHQQGELSPVNSSRESHGHQELSRVNKVKLDRRISPSPVPAQETSPASSPQRKNDASGSQSASADAHPLATPIAPAPPALNSQPSRNDHLRKADDATSIVIPSDEPERGISPDLSAVNQLRREPIVPHVSRNQHFHNVPQQPTQNEHLRKTAT